MTQLFSRRAAVTIGTLRFQADHDANGVAVSGLRIAFKVTQSLDLKLNTAEATVWNLNEAHRGYVLGLKPQFIKNADGRKIQVGPQFLIEAGYSDNFATVFKGLAVLQSNARESPGFATKIAAQDGAEGKSIVNKSLAPGATLAQAIEVIATAMGVNARKAIAQAKSGRFDSANPTFFSGLALYGAAKRELEKLGDTFGFKCDIRDGELVIVKNDETTEEEAVLLNQSTGLIGSPERIYDKALKRAAFKVRSLIQPRIRPGRRIVVKSSEISGTFKIVQAAHEGDTRGAEFYSTALCVEAT